MHVIRTLLLMSIAILGSASLKAASNDDVGLQPTAIKDWRRAEMDGTGCYWSKRLRGPILFVAAGSVGLTKVAGRVVLLSPTKGAGELYPTTYDMWHSDTIAISIVNSGEAEETGYETVTTRADVVVTRNGRTSRLRGFMICGS